jgi:hypothetical protein
MGQPDQFLEVSITESYGPNKLLEVSVAIEDPSTQTSTEAKFSSTETARRFVEENFPSRLDDFNSALSSLRVPEKASAPSLTSLDVEFGNRGLGQINSSDAFQRANTSPVFSPPVKPSKPVSPESRATAPAPAHETSTDVPDQVQHNLADVDSAQSNDNRASLSRPSQQMEAQGQSQAPLLSGGAAALGQGTAGGFVGVFMEGLWNLGSKFATIDQDDISKAKEEFTGFLQPEELTRKALDENEFLGTVGGVAGAFAPEAIFPASRANAGVAVETGISRWTTKIGATELQQQIPKILKGLGPKLRALVDKPPRAALSTAASEAPRIYRFNVEETVTVFRVEGSKNMKLFAGSRPGISVYDVPKEGLWLNFNQEQRALVFLNKRLNKGIDSAVIKQFEVPRSFLNRVRANAVPQRMSRAYPNNPLLSPDGTDQFSIRGPLLKELETYLGYGFGGSCPR